MASVAACCDVCRAPAVHLPCIRLRSLVLTLTTEESPPPRTIVHERRLSPNGLSVTAARCVIRIYTQKIKGLEFFCIFGKTLVYFGTRRPARRRGAGAHGARRVAVGSVGVCACDVSKPQACAEQAASPQGESRSFTYQKTALLTGNSPPRAGTGFPGRTTRGKSTSINGSLHVVPATACSACIGDPCRDHGAIGWPSAVASTVAEPGRR